MVYCVLCVCFIIFIIWTSGNFSVIVWFYNLDFQNYIYLCIYKVPPPGIKVSEVLNTSVDIFLIILENLNS